MRQLTSYLRYPHVARDLITFMAEDDVLARLAERGGRRPWQPGVAADD